MACPLLCLRTQTNYIVHITNDPNDLTNYLKNLNLTPLQKWHMKIKTIAIKEHKCVIVAQQKANFEVRRAAGRR